MTKEKPWTTKKTPQLDSSIDTFVNLIDSIDQPPGVHKIKATLFSMSLSKLRQLGQVFTNYDYESAEYRVTAIILDIAQYRLFRPVLSNHLSTDTKIHFIKRDFIDKGIDTVNLPSILKACQSLKQCQPAISSKIFNFSSTLSDFDYHQFQNNPYQCECNTSSHLYQPYGHVITGDLFIIPDSKLRESLLQKA